MRTLFFDSFLHSPVTLLPPEPDPAALAEVGRALIARPRHISGRSLSIRQVDTGSCNGCELEIHAMNNPYYDIERFGMHFVASPRHADILLVTGPVTHNMRVALERTFAATSEPKFVVAAGDCACHGCVFRESYACVGSVSQVVPVDLSIPGCPPSPSTFLSSLLALQNALNKT